MSETFDDFKSKLDAIDAGIDGVGTHVAALQKQISDLSTQLAAGVPVSQAQLDTLGTEADAIKAKVDALNAAPPTPAP